jgi:colicin import membrane protein
MPRRPPVLKSWNWFSTRASGWQIALLVTLLHVAAVWGSLRPSKTVLAPPKAARVAVATVKLQPPPAPEKTLPAKPKAAPKPSSPAPKPTPPAPKPVEKPKPVVKKNAPPATPAVLSSPPKEKKEQKSYKEAQERIAKIGRREESSKQNSPSSSLNERVPQLEIDRRKGAAVGQEASYCDELAQRLRLLLRLPEYGEVRLVLTLGRDGKVVSVQVTETQSDKNRSYVVDTLLRSSFPPFGSLFPGCDSESFPITLGNEI